MCINREVNKTMRSNLLSLLLLEQKMGYILLSSQLEVLEYDGDNTVFFTHDASQPLQLFDLIPELVGCEDIIDEILADHLPEFNLDNLNRSFSDEEVHYITVKLLRYLDDTTQTPLLLVILVDTSQWTRVQHTLTQQRNELSLLKQSIADTNQRLEFILKRYVPQEVSHALLEKRILPELGGELRQISILFADLRNFTSTSEKHAPNEVIEFLHVCMDIATTAIAEAGGVVVNFMGDAVMALFNAPNEQLDHAKRAVKAGLTIQAMMQFHRTQQSDFPFYFGVGVNTGTAVVGNVGAQWHYQYTAIGDSVNVASRICSHARAGELLVGQDTFKEVSNDVFANPLAPIKFKGKSQEITVYQIFQLKGDDLSQQFMKITN